MQGLQRIILSLRKADDHMISLVKQYKLEFASVPFEPEDGKVYFVSTEINPAADRFVEDNLEELRVMFEQEGLEFIYVRGKIGKDVNGQDIPPTVFSYANSKETGNKGIAFSAYYLDLKKKDLNEVLLIQLRDVANAYSLRRKGLLRFRFAEDPEADQLLEELKRVTRALKMKGVKPEVIDNILSSILVPGKMMVDANGVLVFPDCGNTCVILNPLEKTLYLFLLQHPEGIEPDALVGYRNEFLRIYLHFTIFDDESTIENGIDNLLSEDKKALYTHISRLNKKIETALGKRGSGPYKIQFCRHPEPGRYLIDIPADFIRWAHRF